MPANQYGIDMGEVVNANHLYQDDQMKQQVLNAANSRQNLLWKYGDAASTGDSDAVKAFAMHFPKEAQEAFGALKTMDDNTLQQVAQANDFMGSVSFQLLHTPSEKQEDLYQSIKAQMPPSVQSKFPQNYDEDWAQTRLHLATGTKALIDQEFKTSERQDTEDFNANQNALTRQNRVKIAQTRAGGDGADGSTRVTTQDLSAATHAANGLVGGTDKYDDGGTKTGTDSAKMAQSTAIIKTAVDLRAQGGNKKPLVYYVGLANQQINGGGVASPSKNVTPMPAKSQVKSGSLPAIGSTYKGKTVSNTGIQNSTGKRVIQYSDGSSEYADQP